MRALFKSAILQKKFEEDGFVKISSMLSPNEVSELMKEYGSVKDEHEKIGIPYITTSHSNDFDLISRVDSLLQKVIGPAIDRYLINYKLIFGNYLIKMPGSGSDTSPHQDITFVDESLYASVNLWVALQDTNEGNGCMYFLRGSHALHPTIRPTHDYKWLYQDVIEEVKKSSEIYTAKAGDVFVFNHAVVHGSYSNGSDKPRVAAVIAAYSSDAPLIHYYLPDINKDKVQVYSMTKEAFLHFKKGEPPAKGVFLNEINYEFKQLNVSEFRQLIKRKSKLDSILSSISDFIKYPK